MRSVCPLRPTAERRGPGDLEPRDRSRSPTCRPIPTIAQARSRGPPSFRSIVAVPMMREGVPIGAIAVNRSRARLLPRPQIDAPRRPSPTRRSSPIENVRLFQELEARNRALTEALEQQTATSEILRVISGSPTDVQPVSTRSRGAPFACATHGSPSFFDWRASSSSSSRITDYPSEALEQFLRTASRRLSDGDTHRGASDASGRRRPRSRHRAPPGAPRPCASWLARLAIGACSRCPSCARKARIGAIAVTRNAAAGASNPFSDEQIDAARDLRRAGRHRHRERAPLPGAGDAHRRTSPARWTSSRPSARSARPSAPRSTSRPCSPPSSAGPSSSRAATAASSTSSTSRPRPFTRGPPTRSRPSIWRRCGRRRSSSARARSGMPA